MAQDVQMLEDQLTALNHDPHVDLLQKIDVLNDLAWKLRHVYSQRALALRQTAFEFAQSQTYTQGQLYSFRNLTVLNTYLFPHYDRALSFADRAQPVLDIYPDTLAHAHLLECLAIIYADLGDYSAAHIADFTHSICPSCYEKLYPESYKKRTGQLPSLPVTPAEDSQ